MYLHSLQLILTWHFVILVWVSNQHWHDLCTTQKYVNIHCRKGAVLKRRTVKQQSGASCENQSVILWKSECDFGKVGVWFWQSRSVILWKSAGDVAKISQWFCSWTKSGFDFGKVGGVILWGGAGGGGVEVSVIVSIQCLNTCSAGYGVFHWEKGYSTAGYGVFQWGIRSIPLLDMGYSTAGYAVFHMGYAVNWVWHWIHKTGRHPQLFRWNLP